MSEDTSSKSSLNNSTSSSLSGDLSFTSQLIYQLRLLSVHRSKLIDQIQGKVGAYVCAHLESSIIFHFTVVVTTSYLLLSMFRHEHTVTLFSMHPIFMSIGSIFFVVSVCLPAYIIQSRRVNIYVFVCRPRGWCRTGIDSLWNPCRRLCNTRSG